MLLKLLTTRRRALLKLFWERNESQFSWKTGFFYVPVKSLSYLSAYCLYYLRHSSLQKRYTLHRSLAFYVSVYQRFVYPLLSYFSPHSSKMDIQPHYTLHYTGIRTNHKFSCQISSILIIGFNMLICDLIVLKCVLLSSCSGMGSRFLTRGRERT